MSSSSPPSPRRPRRGTKRKDPTDPFTETTTTPRKAAKSTKSPPKSKTKKSEVEALHDVWFPHDAPPRRSPQGGPESLGTSPSASRTRSTVRRRRSRSKARAPPAQRRTTTTPRPKPDDATTSALPTTASPDGVVVDTPGRRRGGIVEVYLEKTWRGDANSFLAYLEQEAQHPEFTVTQFCRQHDLLAGRRCVSALVRGLRGQDGDTRGSSGLWTDRLARYRQESLRRAPAHDDNNKPELPTIANTTAPDPRAGSPPLTEKADVATTRMPRRWLLLLCCILCGALLAGGLWLLAAYAIPAVRPVIPEVAAPEAIQIPEAAAPEAIQTMTADAHTMAEESALERKGVERDLRDATEARVVDSLAFDSFEEAPSVHVLDVKEDASLSVPDATGEGPLVTPVVLNDL